VETYAAMYILKNGKIRYSNLNEKEIHMEVRVFNASGCDLKKKMGVKLQQNSLKHMT
jgi:hypothetical protein